jgi:phosphoglycerate dehydrogenase-like enzyme
MTRILFCGEAFPASRSALKQRLDTLQVSGELLEWPDAGVAALPDSIDVVIPLMKRIDAAVMDARPFRLIQQWGAGLEGVDLEAAKARQIWVANVPTAGGNAESVAEHAIFLMLSLLRKLPEMQASVRRGGLGVPIGRTLAGRTVCLYGLGPIALALAQRLRPLGVRLLGLTRDPLAGKVAAFGLDGCYATSERNRCLAQTDVLVPCTPLTPETRGLIDAEALAALPPGAYLVNVGRGGLVSYDALVAALSSGRLAGAGLDVYWQEPISPEDPLLALPNVVATPHVAGVTEESYAQIAKTVAENIDRLRRGEPPLNRAA